MGFWNDIRKYLPGYSAPKVSSPKSYPGQSPDIGSPDSGITIKQKAGYTSGGKKFNMPTQNPYTNKWSGGGGNIGRGNTNYQPSGGGGGSSYQKPVSPQSSSILKNVVKPLSLVSNNNSKTSLTNLQKYQISSKNKNNFNFSNQTINTNGSRDFNMPNSNDFINRLSYGNIKSSFKSDLNKRKKSLLKTEKNILRKGSNYYNKSINYIEHRIDPYLNKKNKNQNIYGKTKGAFIKTIIQPTTYLSKGVDIALNKVAGETQKGVDTSIKYEKVKRKVMGNNEVAKYLLSSPISLIKIQTLKDYRKVPSQIIKTGGRIGLYTIPILGESLIASDISVSASNYLGSSNQAVKLAKKDYNSLSKKDKSNISQSEYITQIKPQIQQGIKKQSLTGGITSLALLGALRSVKGIRDYKGYKKFKYETTNYNQAKKILNQQKIYTQYLTTIEKPAVAVSLEKSGLKDLNKLGIPIRGKGNIESVTVSASTQKIINKVPKMVKLEIPKGSKLSKKTNNIYQVYSGESKVSYKNNLLVSIKNKEGKILSFQKSFITDKPLNNFKSSSNALKYAKSKRWILSKISPKNKIVSSSVFKKSGNQITNVGDYLTQSKVIKNKNLPLNNNFKYYSSITKKTGKVNNLLNLNKQELFSLSPKSNSAIIRIKEGNKINKLNLNKQYIFNEKKSITTSLTKSYPNTADLSNVNKIISKTNKYKSKINNKVIPFKLSSKLDTPIHNSEIPIIVKQEPIKSNIKNSDMGSGKMKLDTPIHNSEIPMSVKQESVKNIPEGRGTIIRPLTKPKMDLINKNDIPILSFSLAQNLTTIKRVKNIKGSKQIMKKGNKSKSNIKNKTSYQFKKSNISKIKNINNFNNNLNPTLTNNYYPKVKSLNKPINNNKLNLSFKFNLKTKNNLNNNIKPQQGYNVLIKTKGKYKKITDKPISLNTAKDVRAYFLDRTIARSGRIIPTKGIAYKSNLNVPKGYYNANYRKFRGFRQNKGIKTKLQRTIIEKRRYISDTPGEKRDLNIFRLMAKQERNKKKSINDMPVGLKMN